MEGGKALYFVAQSAKRAQSALGLLCLAENVGLAFGYSSGGASHPRLVAEGAHKRSAAGRRVRSTPPTDEYAKRRAIHQFFGDKNRDFDAISLFFRKTATKSADLNPFKIVADFQLIDPSNERQNIPSFWISPTIFVNYINISTIYKPITPHDFSIASVRSSMCQ